MKQLAKMIALVANKFSNKVDRGGKPYILHCLRVMNQIPQDNETLMCAAVGHDLLEDTELTEESLLQEFDLAIVAKIVRLTHKDGESYDDYIERVSQDKDCVLIKRADLKDNSDITRLKGLTKKDFDRMKKYHRAWVYLSKI